MIDVVGVSVSHYGVLIGMHLTLIVAHAVVPCNPSEVGLRKPPRRSVNLADPENK